VRNLLHWACPQPHALSPHPHALDSRRSSLDTEMSEANISAPSPMPPAISNPSSLAQPPRLDKPLRITEHSWPEGTVPTVSVFCITYNHEKFVRDAIEGFLMQETTFPVEIFIHDDASTDGTQDIIHEYADRHPKLFKLVLQTENQYSKHGFTFLNEYLFNLPGKYIATCEGDDHWLTKNKLEVQTSILNEHPEFVGTFHQVENCLSNGAKVPLVSHDLCRTLYLKDFMTGNAMPTCSVVRRQFTKQITNHPLISKIPHPDWAFCVASTDGGQAFQYADNIKGVRNIHPGGYTSFTPVQKMYIERKETCLNICRYFDFDPAEPVAKINFWTELDAYNHGTKDKDAYKAYLDAELPQAFVLAAALSTLSTGCPLCNFPGNQIATLLANVTQHIAPPPLLPQGLRVYVDRILGLVYQCPNHCFQNKRQFQKLLLHSIAAKVSPTLNRQRQLAALHLQNISLIQRKLLERLLLKLLSPRHIERKR